MINIANTACSVRTNNGQMICYDSTKAFKVGDIPVLAVHTNINNSGNCTQFYSPYTDTLINLNRTVLLLQQTHFYSIKNSCL